jgi:hypothetical protein
MVRIELVPEEAAMLGDILESYLSDLRMEIAGTEAMGFREALKVRETFIKALLARLQEASAGRTSVGGSDER